MQRIINLAVDLLYLDVPLVVDYDSWRHGSVGQARSIGHAHSCKEAYQTLARSCTDRQVDWHKIIFLIHVVKLELQIFLLLGCPFGKLPICSQPKKSS